MEGTMGALSDREQQRIQELEAQIAVMREVVDGVAKLRVAVLAPGPSGLPTCPFCGTAYRGAGLPEHKDTCIVVKALLVR
jgi:hypothetical protein